MLRARVSLFVLVVACAASLAAPLGAQSNTGLPETPSRHAVVAAMNSVAGAVSACGRGRTGLAHVRIEFEGSTGVAKVATVVSASADAADHRGSRPVPADVAACIQREVLWARVPPFTLPRFTVNYPFRL